MVKARARVQLLDDPRYMPFVERYALDLPRFAIEVCGVAPTDQQMEFFDSVQRVGSRTSVASGHGTGKTAAAAVVCWWHLTTHAYSNTILSGPKMEIVLSGVRKYFADFKSQIEAGPQAWIAGHVFIAHKMFYVRGYKMQWWVQAKTAPAGKPEAIAGEHRTRLLWLLDEASGIDDKIMQVILGSLTQEWNRIALMSQPTRGTGFFYDTHHRLNDRRGGNWRSITMNGEESPLVSDSYILEKRMAYGGREDSQYQIKVRGMFPDRLDGQLLSRAQIEGCLNKANSIPVGDDWGNVVLVDVGAGEYRDKSVVIEAKVSGAGQFHEAAPRRMHVVRVPVMSNRIQPTALIGEIVQIAGRLANATILIDCGGLGLGVYKRLDELGVPGLVKVYWGKPCWRRALQDQYFNQRAHGMVAAAKAMIHGQLTIAPNAFKSSTDVTEFLDQHRVPYHFNDRAQYVIESKGSKEWEGLPSPDVFDALAFGFLESATYIPCNDGNDRAEAGSVNAAVERMKALIASRAQGANESQ